MADYSMHETRATSRREARAIEFDVVCNAIAYWLSLIGVYFTVGYIMWMGAAEKLFAGAVKMPPVVAKPFAATWVARFPGLDVLWGVIGVVELVIALVILASIVTGEFLPSHHKSLLQVALGLSLLLFSFLSFGQTITQNFAGALGQYTYFGVTILMMALVRAMPPNRSPRWLTSDPSSMV